MHCAILTAERVSRPFTPSGEQYRNRVSDFSGTKFQFWRTRVFTTLPLAGESTRRFCIYWAWNVTHFTRLLGFAGSEWVRLLGKVPTTRITKVCRCEGYHTASSLLLRLSLAYPKWSQIWQSWQGQHVPPGTTNCIYSGSESYSKINRILAV